jgi:hypothetical protein
MKKDKIKEILRETTFGLEEKASPHIQHAVKADKKTNSVKTTKDTEYEKITTLLDNDLINHAAVVRRMKGEHWTGNSEATNRSKFRKKVKRMANDEGGTYLFNDDELSQIERVLMGMASTISHSIGRQGK